MATESEIEHDGYLQQLSRESTSSTALRDLIFQTVRIIDFISPTIKTIPKLCMFEVFLNPGYSTNYT